MNTAFNFAAQRQNYPGIPCLPGIILAPHFTAPNPVNAGEIVGFNGMESNIALNSADRYSAPGRSEKNFATYTWNFGDGSAPVVRLRPRRARLRKSLAEPLRRERVPLLPVRRHLHGDPDRH